MGQACMSGRQTVQLDQRNRISYPVTYRNAIGDILYISPDQRSRGYLIMRSKEGYENELKRIEAECIEEGEDREEIEDACRDFAGATQNPVPDKNNRITLNKELIEHAGLKGAVVIIGIGEYAEIWDADRLHAYEEERARLKAIKRAKKDAAKRAKMAAEEEA